MAGPMVWWLVEMRADRKELTMVGNWDVRWEKLMVESKVAMLVEQLVVR